MNRFEALGAYVSELTQTMKVPNLGAPLQKRGDKRKSKKQTNGPVINNNKTPEDNHASDTESDRLTGSYGTPSMLSDTKREESMTEVETEGSVKKFQYN